MVFRMGGPAEEISPSQRFLVRDLQRDRAGPPVLPTPAPPGGFSTGQRDVAPCSAPETPGRCGVGTWSSAVGNPALPAARRSHCSAGEGTEKYGKRGTTLLRPCEYLGQKAKSGRLSVLKPTTPMPNNAYSFWRTGGAEGSHAHACARTLFQSIMLWDGDVPAQTLSHCPSAPVLPQSGAGLQRTDRGGSSGSCFQP